MPAFGSETMRLTSHSVEQTLHLGRALGELLRPGDLICLAGDLGAGKTALTRGIGAGWGAREAVTSPTFTLIHEHRRPQDDQVLYHVDCYRLHGAEDAWNIGLDDLLASGGPVVIEWPENVQEMLPDERLWIAFTILDETSRQLSLTASGARSRTLQNALRQQNLGG